MLDHIKLLIKTSKSSGHINNLFKKTQLRPIIGFLLRLSKNFVKNDLIIYFYQKMRTHVHYPITYYKKKKKFVFVVMVFFCFQINRSIDLKSEYNFIVSH